MGKAFRPVKFLGNIQQLFNQLNYNFLSPFRFALRGSFVPSMKGYAKTGVVLSESPLFVIEKNKRSKGDQ